MVSEERQQQQIKFNSHLDATKSVLDKLKKINSANEIAPSKPVIRFTDDEVVDEIADVVPQVEKENEISFQIDIPETLCTNNQYDEINSKNIEEAEDIRLDIGIRMIDAVPDAGLRRKVHHDVEVEGLKKLIHKAFVSQIPPDEEMLHRRVDLLQPCQPPFLQADLVVAVHAVQRNNRAGVHGLQQPRDKIAPDKARRACHQYAFAV